MEAPIELLENPEVNQALKIVEIAAYTPAEMRAYDKFWDNISVQKTLNNEYKRTQERLERAKARIEEAESRIIEAEAKAEKLEQGKLVAAQKLKAMGMTPEQIADVVGLSAEQVRSLSSPL